VNGSPLPEADAWRKSSFSQYVDCVELARLSTGEIALRNSKARGSGVVVFTPQEIKAFLKGAKAGEFDDLAA
jgi:hypothetical protein